MKHKRATVERRVAKTVKDVTPFEIIREVFSLGWEVHSAELVLFELDKIEAENNWMRREVERVGHAIYTGEDGYVGTEEDLQAIGQCVEGICETLEHIPELEAVVETARQLSAGSSDMHFDKIAGMFDDVLVRADDMQALDNALTELENLTTPTK